MSIKRSVAAEKWSSIQNRMKGNSEEARSLNIFIDIMRSRVYEIQKDLIHEGKEVRVELIKNKLLGIDDRTSMLTPIFKEHNRPMEALVGKEYAKEILTRYKTCLSHTKEFLKWKFNLSDVEITQIDHAFISDFDFFLCTEKSCANNSAAKYIKKFGAIIPMYLANRWLIYDPFLCYNSKFIEVKRDFLDEQELFDLANKEFVIERIAQVRDIFLFSCYTGLRILIPEI